MLPLLAIAAASQIPKVIAGFSQLSKSNKALKALGQQAYPEYSVSPEMQGAYNRAQAMSKYGYSPEEKAQMQQEQARNQTAAFQAAKDNGGIYYDNNVDFVNKAAAQGAGLKRQNIQYADSLAQSLQEQKNRQTGSMIARRQMLEQAYGQAKSSAISNITGAAASVGAMGVQSALGAASNKAMVEAARYGQQPIVDETIVQETIIPEEGDLMGEQAQLNDLYGSYNANQ